RSDYDNTKPRPTPPPPSSSAPRTRPAHGSFAAGSPAHGSGLVSLAAGVAVGVASVGFTTFCGVVCGCFLLHAGAPSIAPATTTVRQITLVASRFIPRA